MVLQHCISLMADEEAGPQGWGREIQKRAYFFYADDGLIKFTQTEWLQRAFEVLSGMFDQARLTFTCHHKTLRKDIWATDGGGGNNIPGMPEAECPMHGLCSRLGDMVYGVAMLDEAHIQLWLPMGPPPTPPPPDE